MCHRTSCLLLFILSIFGSAPCFSNEPIKIEDFTKLPEARDVKISPDGKHLSVVFKKNGVDYLGVLDRATLKVLKTFGVKGKGKSVGETFWSNNKRIVYGVIKTYSWDKQRYDNGELVGVNIDGTQHKLIFGYNSGAMQISSRRKGRKAEYGNHEIIDSLNGDDDNILILFSPWKVKGRYWVVNHDAKPIIYRLNIYTSETRRIDNLPIPESRAITDNNGELRFSIGISDNYKHEVYYKNINSKKWENFKLGDFEGSSINPLSFSEDNKNVYLSANVGNGTRALYILNLEKQTTEKLFHDENIDISRTIKSFENNRVIAVATELALPAYHYLKDTEPKSKLHKKLLKSFPGNDVIITSSSKGSEYFIAFVYSDKNPGDYYLFETKKLTANYLFSKNKQIDPLRMSTTESVTFTMRDQQVIQGYLTKPIGKKKNLPLVVVPHGGPHGVRDEWGFDWEVQLLANRGYAVLQMNYRGSGGFGRDFLEAGHGKWGTLMQDDITDATLAVIEQGIADPERICIFGASYGGYASLMGVVREPELYQCAIGSAGVYNLPMMFVKGDIPDLRYGISYLKEALGENVEDQKLRSPTYNVSKIKAEILLIHGSKDKRVPVEQVESLKEAFDTVDKKYEWLELPYDGHGYYDEESRLLVYNKVLSFLDRTIGKNR